MRLPHDGKYLDYIDREWWKTSSLLYDPQEHLYFRDATYLSKTEPNGQKMFWSRGNGWVLAGFARLLQYTPKDDLRETKYIQQYREMAAKLVTLQSKDGLWRSGLLDPDYYVLPENSGSALITYGLAYGINEGILDRKVLHSCGEARMERSAVVCLRRWPPRLHPAGRRPASVL